MWLTERERLGYVGNLRSLKEGTETLRPLATVAVPPLYVWGTPSRLLSKKLICTWPPFIPALWGGVRDAKHARQLSLACFINTRRWLGSQARSHLRQSLWGNVSVPSFMDAGYLCNWDLLCIQCKLWIRLDQSLPTHSVLKVDKPIHFYPNKPVLSYVWQFRVGELPFKMSETNYFK